MGGLSPVHWLLVLVVALVIFGPKKLPELAQSLGKALREFKKAQSEMASNTFPACTRVSGRSFFSNFTTGNVMPKPGNSFSGSATRCGNGNESIVARGNRCAGAWCCSHQNP